MSPARFIHAGINLVPKRSCLTNWLVMEVWVTWITDDHETVGIVFLDFAKAFDSANHRFSLTKLRAYDIHDDIVSRVAAFLGNRSFRVAVNGCHSEVTAAESGVLQGSVLGPLLYLLYVKDLPDLLTGKVLLFADDVKLVSPRSSLDTLLRDLQIPHE